MDPSIERKQKELADKAKEGDRLQQLMQEFPDLRIVTDRWKRERYSSKAVNARAAKVDFRHNCGCCPDSPLEARPYIETMGTQVFSHPVRFWIGERDGMYETETPGWETDMRKAGISDAAIEKVRCYLAATARPDDDDEDDEDDIEPLF